MERIKLAVLDFDSTLCRSETLFSIYSAWIKNTEEAKRWKKEIAEEVAEYRLDYSVSLTKRAKALRGIPIDFVKECCRKLEYNKGAKELIQGLKQQGYIIVVMSGGFEDAVELTKDIGVDEVFANNFVLDSHGRLTGQVTGCMMHNSSKGQMLRKLQKLMGVAPENTLVVGDGANDLSMFHYSDTRVAFCACELLKSHANVVINEPDLSLILNELKS